MRKVVSQRGDQTFRQRGSEAGAAVFIIREK